ncbi:zinc finger MYM-type protein 1-like [Aphis gossypii]|uniref:zinc finger MYM-type protein 1-like n=1 Tax=Aphis gossypii TaxID=80765 RepID=UPI002158F6F6|nr:zinc finger MYM-type protein 1-like [Aphis gossypii]
MSDDSSTSTTSTSTSSTCHPNTELDITPSPTILSVSTPLELEKGNHAGDARNLISIDIAKYGYDDWNNVHSGLTSHENSSEHIQSSSTFLNRSKLKNRIDKGLQLQIQNEMNYWRNVLQRVVAVVKKLGSRGLPFRGKNEQFGSNKNGNFMMCLELIAEFDPFMSNHLATYGNPGRGKTSYLSSTICEEFISLIAKKVLNVIIDEVNRCKYFSIVVDSTPDISHVDELSFVIRYVKREIQEDTPADIERFLKFIPNVGHKAIDMLNAVTGTLEEFGLNLQK